MDFKKNVTETPEGADAEIEIRITLNDWTGEDRTTLLRLIDEALACHPVIITIRRYEEPDSSVISFQNAIRELLLQNDMTGAALAKLIHTTASQLSRVKTGKLQMPRNALRRLIALLQSGEITATPPLQEAILQEAVRLQIILPARPGLS